MINHNRHKRQRAQGLVEFSLIAPVFFALLFGLIAVGWLFFQQEAIQDAAREAAREATIETSLNTSVGSVHCESNSPLAIETAAQQGANILTVNPGRLCSSGNPDVLTQPPAGGGTNDASVQVTVTGSITAPSEVTVTVAYAPLPFWFGNNFTFTASSTLPPQ